MQFSADAHANPLYACMPHAHAHAHQPFMAYAPCPRGALYKKKYIISKFNLSYFVLLCPIVHAMSPP